ncbi:MAG TPA: hypothetical protein IAB17_06635 [Candidatus Alectryocaccobium stercorigallinarum]|nr:hypothetical protein [Candidatus Alectryocaccobium stercorigallinarum]
MTGQEYILDALQFLDDDLLLEASGDSYKNKKALSENMKAKSLKPNAEKAHRRAAFSLKKLAVVSGICAACLVGVILYRGNALTTTQDPGTVTGEISNGQTADTEQSSSQTAENHAEKYDGLPVLSLPKAQQSDGMGSDIGFVHVLAYDISELVNSNPWTESAELTELPVYVNSHPSYPWPPAVSENLLNEMNAFLTDIAERMGIHEDELIFSDDASSEEALEKTEGAATVTSVSAQWQDITLTVHYDMTAEIRFSEPIQLPAEYAISGQPTYAKTENAALYLKEKYSGLLNLNMQGPQINVYGGEYMDTGERSIYSYKLSFYDGSGSYTDQIIQYNFYKTEFYFDDNNELYLIRINNTDLSNTAGDYPIISADEAEEYLKENEYGDMFPYDVTDESVVADVELVYYYMDFYEYFIPYYKFYVEQPSENENGLKRYDICYIPAIESKYIEYVPETFSIWQ